MSYRDVVATLGTYEKDGQKKYLTRKVGTLLETQHGLRLKLDATFNPAGCERTPDGFIWLAVFDPQPRQEALNTATPTAARQQPKHAQEAPGGNFDDFDDDIPF